MIITWKLDMMPQGDTESKTSMGDAACSITVLLAVDFFWDQRKTQR